MRSLGCVLAAALAAQAAVMGIVDDDGEVVAFFIGLTLLGVVAAWAVRPPYVGRRRTVAIVAAGVWIGAALWVGVLLLMFAGHFASMGGPLPPERTYLGLTATVYHVVGLYGGALAIGLSAFAPRPQDPATRPGRTP